NLLPQLSKSESFFSKTCAGGPIRSPTTDFQNFLLGAPQGSFGAGGVFNHEYHNSNFAVFAQDDWKIRQDLTVNRGLRAEMFGAFYDNLCHIGNLDPALAAAGQFPYIYPSCVSKLKLTGLSGTANGSTTSNKYSTGLGTRLGLA